MKQSIQLRLGQQLTMTPQLQQAIRLLQLSTLDLQMEVQQALDSNLMLEQGEEEAQGGGDGSETTEQPAVEAPKELAADQNLTKEQNEIPENLAVDSAWEDIYDTGPSYSGPAPDDDRDLEPRGAQGPTLQEHLSWQMEMSLFGETDRAIATAIIDAINEDGYLDMGAEEIFAGLTNEIDELALDEVEAVLHRIQTFDPPGVGAQNVQECLKLQIRQLNPDTPWRDEAIDLVDNHLELLAAHNHNQLTRRMKLSDEQLAEVVELVRSLTPRPGSLIASSQAEYVIPDVFVRKFEGAWRVELNQEAIPRLRINQHYANLIRRADNSADNNYLRTHLQEARWFLKSLQSRHETLLKVATAIVERQQGFFEYGDEAMKPLVLRDIAEVVEMHESTISRVTTQKYMHTPRGVYELKYFFSSHVGTADGGECSATAIRALIKKLIAEENSAKPLSDSKLADTLKERGINVARRTVAKYREAMSIPPSNERKRLM